jgi:hypothetical protein
MNDYPNNLPGDHAIGAALPLSVSREFYMRCHDCFMSLREPWLVCPRQAISIAEFLSLFSIIWVRYPVFLVIPPLLISRLSDGT